MSQGEWRDGRGGERGRAGRGGERGRAGRGRECGVWIGDAQLGTAKEDAVPALASGSAGVVLGGYFNGMLGETKIEPSGNSRGFIRALSTSGSVL